jgi:hypothetical protein
MEKKQPVQIKYEDQEIKREETQRIENVFGVIRNITGTPSGTPVKFADQLLINSSQSKLWVYDLSAGTWKSASLT